MYFCINVKETHSNKVLKYERIERRNVTEE
jgi:hypothetical protein